MVWRCASDSRALSHLKLAAPAPPSTIACCACATLRTAKRAKSDDVRGACLASCIHAASRAALLSRVTSRLLEGRFRRCSPLCLGTRGFHCAHAAHLGCWRRARKRANARASRRSSTAYTLAAPLFAAASMAFLPTPAPLLPRARDCAAFALLRYLTLLTATSYAQRSAAHESGVSYHAIASPRTTAHSRLLPVKTLLLSLRTCGQNRILSLALVPPVKRTLLH